MVNHPNRNAATIETLRSEFVPSTKNIKQGSFAEINKADGERLILVVDWELRKIFLTVVQGPYGHPRIKEGLDKSFEIDYLFPRNRTISEAIGYYEGDLPKPNYNGLYQNYILNAIKRAEKIFDGVSDGDIEDDIKSKVIAALEPYRSHYE
jgi:hypothetical protein